MEINSKNNERVKQWVRYQERKHRQKDRMFLVEGMHLIEEAHQQGLIECIIVKKGYSHPFTQYPMYEVSDEIMKKISSSVSGSDIIAQLHYLKEPSQLKERIILLDNIQDPGNVGTMIRTAYSFGFDCVVLSSQGVDLYNEKLIRSSQGAIFHIDVMQRDLSEVIQILKTQDIPVYATDLKASKPLSQIESKGKCAIVFGNEGSGVSGSILKQCDQNIIIEMPQFESLNVAVAAGICMYHFKKG